MKILLSESQLQAGIVDLAGRLRARYEQRPITIVAIMTGSLVFLADLIRRLDMPLHISLIQASSYRGGTTSGDLSLSSTMMLDITGRDCLLLDDIFDTGKTLSRILDWMWQQQPASVTTAVLLNKVGQSRVAVRPDYSVFDIPNEFVVGYGLDYDDLYRNLPYVGVMEAEDLRQHASGR